MHFLWSHQRAQEILRKYKIREYATCPQAYHKPTRTSLYAIKATSTFEPPSVNTAVADKAVAGTKDTAALTVKVVTTSEEAKFDDGIPEADQLNFDVAGGEANFKTEVTAAEDKVKT